MRGEFVSNRIVTIPLSGIIFLNWHAACIEGKSNACGFFIVKLERNKPRKTQVLLVDNIKTHLIYNEYEIVEWSHMAVDKDQQRVVVTKVP